MKLRSLVALSFLHIHLKLPGLWSWQLWEENPKTRGEEERVQPSEIGRLGKQAIGGQYLSGVYLTSYLHSSQFLEAYKKFLSLQKEMTVLAVLVFPLFVICAEIHTVEKALNSCLGIIEAWGTKNGLGLKA